MSNILLICVAVLAIPAWFLLTYNKFVSLKNLAAASWSDIDVQLKRRHDLVPNLEAAVQAYAGHEKETFERVVRARGAASGAQGVKERSDAEVELTTALRSVLLVVENYPELKASANFLDLHKALVAIEDDIQNARRFYNAVVRDFNIKCESFPSTIVAKTLRFGHMEFFHIEPGEKENVELKMQS
jgi:LemA protein